MNERSESLRKDAQMRTPDRWYFNQYVNGRLVMSHGFHTKELAESFERSVNSEIASWIRDGKKLREGVVHKIEEAIGWEVAGKEFGSFSDALFYKWTEYPDANLNGVFRH